jgi:NitT/TauT family transport system substrate-binding protein
MRKTTIFFIVLIFGIWLNSCGQQPDQETQKSNKPTLIRMTVLPILDTLPMYVAEKEGIFEKHQIEVEFIPAGSAPKRDELINAGQADGMINEIVSTIFYNRDQTQVQIVRYARTATSDSGIFQILASAQSGITDIQQLKGAEIGISHGTVIEYLTDRLLQAEGFSQDEIRTIAVPDIGQRMALLGSGELRAAMLPDPLASLILQQGAVFILDDSLHPNYSHSVYTFRKEFIDQNSDAVRGFLAAVEEAVELINANPDNYGVLLTERELVPPPLAGSFKVPQFVTNGVPTQSQWDDVAAWINEKNLDVGNATYEDSINASFLP